jgi:hypothetical protein
LLGQVWYTMLGAEDLERQDDYTDDNWELDYNEWKAQQ